MNLAPEVRTTMIAMFAGLCLASVASILLVQRKPQHDYSELRARIRTWWVIVVVFCGALYCSSTAAVVFFGMTSFLALKEFLSMTPTRRADRRVLFYAYLAIPIQYYFASTGWYGMFIVFIPVWMFVWLPTRMWMMGQTDGFLRAAGSLHWGLMLTVFSLSHAAFLLHITPGESARFPAAFPSEVSQTNPGPGLLLLALLLTQMNDIFQYLWGKSIGGAKVAPLISPGKTYAGLIGGVLSTVVLAGLLGPYLTILDLPRSLMGGVIIGLGGFAGDLSLSALKRDLKIKDFGATLPGHGGVLDRVDSLIFTAPLFFHFVYYGYG